MKFFNKHIQKVALAGAFALLAASCTPENPLEYDGPELFHFASTDAPYFVLEASDPGLQIPVGVTTISTSDRTFNVSIDVDNSTAVEGVHYTLSGTSVTIPAGDAVGYITVNGDFDQLGTDGPQTLVLTLASGETTADFYTEFTAVLQQFCPYNQSDFVGGATATSTLFAASFPITIEAGATANELILKDLYSAGNDIAVTLDDSDPSNFTARITSGLGWVSGAYGDVTVDNSLTGAFSACNGTITLTLSHCVAAGCFPDDNLSIVLD